MKAILHHQFSDSVVAQLNSAAPPWLKIEMIHPLDTSRLEKELLDADVLLHVLTPITRDMLDCAPRLKLIQKIGVGVNTIDRQAAAEKDITVANMPGTNSQAVCEMTLALMLATTRKTALLDKAVRAGKGWELSADITDSLTEIAGKTVGLIGYGAVPQRLAPVLSALGADVIVHAKSKRDSGDGGVRFVGLHELLGCADIVSFHVPLTPETKGLLGPHNISHLKKGAIIINTARGGLVDEAVLAEALRTGRVKAAGLDVFQDEPVAADEQLLSFPNVVATPHIAWLTRETLNRSFEVIIENCRRLSNGQPLLHEVSYL